MNILLYYKRADQRNVDHPKLIVTDDITSRCRWSQGQTLEADYDMCTMYIYIHIYTILFMLLG
jgi:hypothetical protein